MIERWMRECQECGYEMETTPPPAKMTDKWLLKKCPKCKSEGSLDYGSVVRFDENGNEITWDDE